MNYNYFIISSNKRKGTARIGRSDGSRWRVYALTRDEIDELYSLTSGDIAYLLNHYWSAEPLRSVAANRK